MRMDLYNVRLVGQQREIDVEVGAYGAAHACYLAVQMTYYATNFVYDVKCFDLVERVN